MPEKGSGEHMSNLTDLELREIERLSQKEEDEPEFVTKRKQEMIALIKAGRIDEITRDEWGEVFYLIDSNNSD